MVMVEDRRHKSAPRFLDALVAVHGAPDEVGLGVRVGELVRAVDARELLLEELVAHAEPRVGSQQVPEDDLLAEEHAVRPVQVDLVGARLALAEIVSLRQLRDDPVPVSDARQRPRVPPDRNERDPTLSQDQLSGLIGVWPAASGHRLFVERFPRSLPQGSRPARVGVGRVQSMVSAMIYIDNLTALEFKDGITLWREQRIAVPSRISCYQ
jgi:hypothetical protein